MGCIECFKGKNKEEKQKNKIYLDSSTNELYEEDDTINKNKPQYESLKLNNDSSSNNNTNYDKKDASKKETEEIAEKNYAQEKSCETSIADNYEPAHKKNIIESQMSNLNENKENLSKDLKELDKQIQLEKEGKKNENENNIQNKMQNNIINNKLQANQLMQPNLGNNQINQNIPNSGYQWNMNFFPNQNFNNNPFLMNNIFQNNFQRPNQLFNQNNFKKPNQLFNQNQNNFQKPNQIFNQNQNNFQKQNQIFNQNNYQVPNQIFNQNNYQKPNQIFNQNQNNQINNQNQKELEPIQTYEKPTLIGLNNIGATCYRNSVLQCLSQTKGLTNYFLNPKNYNRIMNPNSYEQNQINLCPIYYNLIKNLWNKNTTIKSFSPDEFMKSIDKMTAKGQAKFVLGKAGDAKDFVLYLLETMHKELKQPLKNKFWKIEPKDQQLNQYDKHNTLIHFLDDFQNETSIMSDLFFGIDETTMVCQYCKNIYNSKGQKEPISYNYGIFNILIFPLEEVRKYRNKAIELSNLKIILGNMSNIMNMFECFYYNQKNDLFTGDNKNYCKICNQLYDSVRTNKIYTSPNVLILILNRGKGNIYDVKLNFDLTIDISDFVLSKDGKQIYNLYGVITLLGKSGPNAHFVASCKSPVDGIWYRYNDALVDPIKDLQKDMFNFGTPYILFYEKQN